MKSMFRRGCEPANPVRHDPTDANNHTGFGSPPILSKEKADQVIHLLADPYFAEISGNHMTVLFGERATTLADTILGFVGAT